MKPIRRNLALLAAATSLAAGGAWLLPSPADAHDCIVLGTSVTTIQTASDCTALATNPMTTSHVCTGSADGVTLFVCVHNPDS
ncbi:MAG: hypothetical protein M3394_03515 [Actinomycetota bacterium]|nr:hypothetical protein [Actinomycetota bacterium]